MNLSDAAIAATILTLVDERGAGKTICPSEAAKRLLPDPGDGWREAMPAVRRVAVGLADTGALSITQKGQPVDPATARGPIRLGKKIKPVK